MFNTIQQDIFFHFKIDFDRFRVILRIRQLARENHLNRVFDFFADLHVMDMMAE